MDQPRFCRDCKHASMKPGVPLCLRPILSLVTGESAPLDDLPCHDYRSHHLMGPDAYGPEGQYWMPR